MAKRSGKSWGARSIWIRTDNTKTELLQGETWNGGECSTEDRWAVFHTLPDPALGPGHIAERMTIYPSAESAREAYWSLVKNPGYPYFTA